MKCKTFSEILKFNPYHDSRGRFTTGNGYASFTIRTKDPAKQHMADMAIAREKERNPTATNNKTPEKPQNESPRMQTVHAVEDKIKSQNYESAAVVDDNGNQLYFKDGSFDEVRFTRLECMQMANNTMIHNHPRCSMFSWEDLNCMVVNQLYETRIVNRDGTVYSMKRAGGGYSTDKAREFVKKYKDNYVRGTMHAQRDLDSRGFQDKLYRKEITHAEANIEFGRSSAKYMADWTAKEAPKYGFEFTIEQRPTTARKSIMVMKENKSSSANDGDVVLDAETNKLLDTAFNEWLEKAQKKGSGKTAKSFKNIFNERSNSDQ